MRLSRPFLARPLPQALALCAALFAALGAQANPIVVKHAQGEATLATTPAKVIPFDLASLDILDRLGVKVSGVPSGPKPGYLAKYDTQGAVKAGTLFEPDYEAVNAAQPDLIIIAGRSAAKYAALAKIAPTIDLTPPAGEYIPGIKANVRMLGRIFGKEAQAEAEVTSLEADIAALKAKSAGKGRGLVLLTTGGKISAFGPDSRFGVVHDAFGIAPAAPDIKVGNHGQPVSSEFILKVNPDWLFIVDRDAAIGHEGQSARQLLDNALVGQTSAWKKGQVIYLDAASWYLVGGGLTAMHRSIDQLAQAFDKAS